jgi:Leishmanolysin
MDPNMFSNFQGYANGYSDIIQQFDDSRTIIKSPNVLKTVQQHFNCTRMLGAELEDDCGRGSRSSHWEQRIFEV